MCVCVYTYVRPAPPVTQGQHLYVCMYVWMDACMYVHMQLAPVTEEGQHLPKRHTHRHQRQPNTTDGHDDWEGAARLRGPRQRRWGAGRGRGCEADVLEHHCVHGKVLKLGADEAGLWVNEASVRSVPLPGSRRVVVGEDEEPFGARRLRVVGEGHVDGGGETQPVGTEIRERACRGHGVGAGGPDACIHTRTHADTHTHTHTHTHAHAHARTDAS